MNRTKIVSLAAIFLLFVSVSCSAGKSGTALFLATLSPASAHAQMNPSASVDVFLVAGQSNSVGRGDSSQSPVPPPGKVLSYYNGAITNVVDPVGNANTGSAWPAFGTAYYNATGRIVAFVPTAVGGSSQTVAANQGTGTWDASGTLFNASAVALDSAMKALSGAGYTPTFRGVLWDQGEEDAIGINGGVITSSDYQNALTSMIARYRTRYSASMPFFIFQTGTAPAEPDAGYAAIRNIQTQVTQADSNTRLVFQDAVNFPSRGLMKDAYHYTQAGYNQMGTTGAQNLIASGLVNVKASVAPVNPSSPVFASAQTASGLTQTQITAIIGLLQAFNADQSVINSVQNALNGAQTTQTQQTTNQTTQTTSTSLTAPTITSISPSIITAGQQSTLIVNGSNFQSGATVSYTGTGSGSVPSTLYSPGLLSFGPYSYNFGAYTFTVKNPGPDGQTSNSMSVMVRSSSLASNGNPIPTAGTTTGTTPACVAPVAPAPYSGSIPTTCFGRSVEYFSDVSAIPSGYISQMKPNVMKLVRIKTGAAGTMYAAAWITDPGIEGTTIGFISTTPCGYTEAYNNDLALPGTVGGGWKVYSALPTLAENQVQTYFDIPANQPTVGDLAALATTFNNFAAYRKAYLKPNTYYYLSVVNSSPLIEGSDTQFVKTNEDLLGTHDSCLTSYAQAKGGTCTYERFEPIGVLAGTIPGLPAPITTPTAGSCVAPSGGGAIPPGPSCGGASIAGTGTTQPATNASPCTLPNGSTLAVGTNSSGGFYWKASSVCYSAPFYCDSSKGLIPGLQFSPMPPQPSRGDTIYADQTSCTSGTGGVSEGNGGGGASSSGTNGTCGASACGSFSSAPTSGLCTTGTAYTMSGTGPFTWSCIGSNGGSSVSCSAGKSGTPPPVTPPISSSCDAFPTYGTGTFDRVLSPLEQALFPAGQRELGASGDFGTAIQFVADASKYPLGILIQIVDETQPGYNKQFVVSACPHNFSNPINKYADRLLGGGGNLVLRFGGVGSISDGDVPLVAGQTYYLNMREAKFSGDTSPRGTVYTQMSWDRRRDP